MRPVDRFCSSDGQLHTLRLTAGQRRRRLPQPHVAQPDVDQRLQVPMDRGDRFEELRRVLDRHVEHLGDGLALVVHLEGFPVVPGALADLARHVHVGQEVHLDLDGAVAGARLAAAALDVERESARLIPTHLGLGGGGEQRADLVEHAGVRGGVRPRRPADRRLVDADQLVHLVQPGDAGMPARHLAGAVELVRQHRRQDVVDQCRLAGARDARHRREHAQRERHIDLAQVVFARTDNRELPLAVGRAPDGRDLDLLFARKIGAGKGIRVASAARRTGRCARSGRRARPHRADVDHPVGMGDGVQVVFDDDQRVAQIP